MGDIDRTANILSVLNISQSLDRTGKNELESLAHAIVDLREAGSKLSDLCAQICSGELQTKVELDDKLTDIRMELNHIVYHIADSDYLSSVLLPYIEDKKQPR